MDTEQGQSCKHVHIGAKGAARGVRTGFQRQSELLSWQMYSQTVLATFAFHEESIRQWGQQTVLPEAWN